MKGLPRLCERLELELQQAIQRVAVLSKETSLPAAAAQVAFIKEQTARANEILQYEILPLMGRERDLIRPPDGTVISDIGPVAKKPGEE